MIVTNKHLPRRTFLRGVGATLALPLLDGMIPAFGGARVRAAAAPTRRLGIIYVPNGIVMARWTPQGDATALDVMPILEPLAPFREQIVMVTGLSNAQGDALPGEGAGDHARASGAYLTGVHPKKTEGADIRAGVSMDQIAAGVLGQRHRACVARAVAGIARAGGRLRSGLQLRLREHAVAGAVRRRRCRWRTIRGSCSSACSAPARAPIRPSGARGAQQDRSILDAVRTKANRLRLELGSSDRAKLDQYLDAIRDLERRISRGEQQAARELPAFDQPAGIPRTFEEHAKLMFDLQVLAYQADLTRVITFMVGHETSQRAYPEIGVSDAHHPLSHHGGNREKIERLIKVNTYHTTMFAYYLEKLRATPDGDGSLLDHLTLIYGSGMSDGNIHNHHDLPTLVVGGGSGTIKGGRHLRYPAQTPVDQPVPDAARQGRRAARHVRRQHRPARAAVGSLSGWTFAGSRSDRGAGFIALAPHSGARDPAGADARARRPTPPRRRDRRRGASAAEKRRRSERTAAGRRDGAALGGALGRPFDGASVLIKAGARLDAVNDLGVFPLSLACGNGSGAMVEAVDCRPVRRSARRCRAASRR